MFDKQVEENDAPRPARKRQYYFLPMGWQRQNTIIWLRKIHAWTGLWGALIFLFLGVSGFLLNHRSVWKIDTGPAEVSEISVMLNDQSFESREAFARWFENEFDIGKSPLPERRPSRAATFNGQTVETVEEWRIRYNGPETLISATYKKGAAFVDVAKSDRSFWTVVKNFHKGSGLTVAWILFIDSIAGALIAMSITGILLWSRFHGGKLLAGSLLFGGVLLAIATALPGLLFSSL